MFKELKGPVLLFVALLMIFLITSCPPIPVGPGNFPSFPDPYPKPSTLANLTRHFANIRKEDSTHLYMKDINSVLSHALEVTGYFETRYFGFKDGFVICTQLERFYEDGRPADYMDRWKVNGEPRTIFSIKDYLKLLFTADPGKYRMIAFVVTNEKGHSSKVSPAREDVENWMNSGALKLPKKIDRTIFSDEGIVFALIYEFEKSEYKDETTFIEQSSIPGFVHIANTRILDAINYFN